MDRLAEQLETVHGHFGDGAFSFAGELDRIEGDDADPDAFLRLKLRPWIVGTVEDVAEQLGALRVAGVARVMCQHLLHTDLDAVALIARDLAPLVA